MIKNFFSSQNLASEVEEILSEIEMAKEDKQLMRVTKDVKMSPAKDSQPLGNVKGSTTLIPKEAHFTGDITFSGNLHIEGKIVGSVIASQDGPAMVSVVDGGCVEGEIRVPAVLIDGAVIGDIHSSERLEIAEHAEIQGDVYYNLVDMAIGSRLNGTLRHVTVEAPVIAQANRFTEQSPADNEKSVFSSRDSTSIDELS